MFEISLQLAVGFLTLSDAKELPLSPVRQADGGPQLPRVRIGLQRKPLMRQLLPFEWVCHRELLSDIAGAGLRHFAKHLRLSSGPRSRA
ncbi:hypothetical protein OE766_15450 [Pararhizobium sp. YC-54]|uniref:hypothetical protein n=1 Tax=Pararhizobium sp. YC-54 TaxID=2986920 RepID=UPI0021F78B54|nr:hypothetical protein [Pararhizobium sp. YC-54]MCV9999638.1 hypothetical protein [Pararhizobium sp. YC-54]